MGHFLTVSATLNIGMGRPYIQRSCLDTSIPPNKSTDYSPTPRSASHSFSQFPQVQARYPLFVLRPSPLFPTRLHSVLQYLNSPTIRKVTIIHNGTRSPTGWRLQTLSLRPFHLGGDCIRRTVLSNHHISRLAGNYSTMRHCDSTCCRRLE